MPGPAFNLDHGVFRIGIQDHALSLCFKSDFVPLVVVIGVWRSMNTGWLQSDADLLGSAYIMAAASTGRKDRRGSSQGTRCFWFSLVAVTVTSGNKGQGAGELLNFFEFGGASVSRKAFMVRHQAEPGSSHKQECCGGRKVLQHKSHPSIKHELCGVGTV